MENFNVQYAQEKDMPELLELANQAFAPVNFASLLPKLYGANANTAQKHIVVREQGKICAMLCLEILTVKVEELLCKAGYIGTVAVSEAWRGKGCMNILLERAREEMAKEGCALGVLGGQRQRYEYFGFEPAGEMWRFKLTKSNVKHICADGENKVSLQPLSLNKSWVNAAVEMYNAQKMICIRDVNDFCAILQSWKAKAMAIVNNGEFAGYCSVSFNDESPCVQELLVLRPDLLPACCRELLLFCHCESCCVSLPNLPTAEARFFAQIAEEASLCTNHSFAVYDWCTVLRPFLRLQSLCKNLADCAFRIGVMDADSVTNLLFTVKNSLAEVCIDNTLAADITLTQLAAISLFFAPCGSVMAQASTVVAGLFPLPLYISFADSI